MIVTTIAMGSTRKRTIVMPRYSERRGTWIGGSRNVLWSFVDTRTGRVTTRPIGYVMGPACTVRIATRAEACTWQNPPHPVWIFAP